MDKIFGSLKSFIKLSNISIDNHAFRLHYKLTVALLMASSILVTSRQYFGDPIDCISKDSVPSKILDNFCWIHSTFSVRAAWNRTVGSEVPYPGVDSYTADDERVYHAYYQWVCFVLFLQAALFYLPRYLWKACEGRKISSLVMDLSDPLNDDKKRGDSIAILCRYFHENRGHHGGYFYTYFMCEFLNLVNVIAQIHLVDAFLGGEFWTYGKQVFQFSEWDQAVRFDPMVQVFPRLTKCTFHMYGSSGDVQKYDAMCILPINIINEKIYIFMWFWFVFLALVSTLTIIYRAFLVFYKPARYHVLAARARLAEKRDLRMICAESDLGDWFLVSLLSKNLDSVAYKMFARKLREQLEDSAKSTIPYVQSNV